MTNIRAIRTLQLGSLEGLRLDNISNPTMQAGELRIRVAASAMSHADMLLAQGRYQIRPPVPFIPGSEFAGTVDAIGPSVQGWKIGERVCGSCLGGAWAEALCVPASSVHRIGTEVSLHEAAALAVPFSTVWHALVDRAQLQPGEIVFVLGAAGSIGHAAVQVATALGARVIAGGSTPSKRALALQAGATETVDTSVPNWASAVKACAGPRGIDVLVDPVGGAFTEQAFRTLGWGGRHLVLGFASGSIASLPANLALLKGAALIGVDIRKFTEREPAQATANMEQVVALHANGKVQPALGNILPMTQYQQAVAALQSGSTLGRVLLVG